MRQMQLTGAVQTIALPFTQAINRYPYVRSVHLANASKVPAKFTVTSSVADNDLADVHIMPSCGSVPAQGTMALAVTLRAKSPGNVAFCFSIEV